MTCQHESFSAEVEVIRITDGEGGDVAEFMAHVRVRCGDCGAPCGFAGVPGGLSFDRPMMSVDARELRAPLLSPAQLALAGPLPGLDAEPHGEAGTP